MEKIVTDGIGYHNGQLEDSILRLQRGRGNIDCSTVCLIPSRGMIPARVVQNWFNFISPMNQKFFKMTMIGMEVGEAYCAAIEMILANPELSKWKYILTLEDDNLPPPDGLLKLLEDMEEVDVVGGLYWTKGPGGQPMIYGDINEVPLNFRPQIPQLNTLQRCNGLGMGFTLFKMDIFKDKRIEKPWFKTVQTYDPVKGSKAYTQDLHFFEKIKGLGYRVACDTRVLVGHFDVAADIVW
jgi:hypothetical protein